MDYIGLTQNEVLITSSPSSECLVVSVFEDTLVEADETFLVQLTTDDRAVSLVQPNFTEVTIINTDGTYDNNLRQHNESPQS